jgi:hypothetical protein
MANEKRAGNSDQIPIPPLAASVSRRGFLTGAGAVSLAAAAVPLAATRAARGAGPAKPDGTPEQIHLTWGEDPSRVVIVSWASAAQAINPRVHFGGDCSFGKTVPAVQRTYTDGLNGQTVFTYHARLEDLRPDSPHHYAVTADNDSHGADPLRPPSARRPSIALRFAGPATGIWQRPSRPGCCRIRRACTPSRPWRGSSPSFTS